MTRTEKLVALFQEQIEAGTLKPGERLPSIRRAAEEYGVSKNTVIEAYERLVAAGWIIPRPGSGFYINAHTTAPATAHRPHFEEARDAVSLLQAQLDKSFTLRVGDGRPPSSWMGEQIFRRHMKSPVGDADEQSGYGSALGYTRLRERLASLHQTQGLKVTSSQILMTFGANHALDLITRYFLTPGCTVLVDEPGYYPLFAKLKLARVNIEGVRRTPQGPDLNELEQKARDLKPVMFFTQSRGQNPTGSSMDLPTAHEVLRLADRHSMLVVDDDPFLHLPDVDGTPLSLLDQFRNTICIGTFAKTLSASLRAGYIMAREDIIAPLTELKMITSVNSSRHSEMLIYNFLERGEYHRHLKRLQNRINEAARAVISGTEKAGYELFCPPTGGYYTYLTLPDGMNDLEVAKRGAAEGIFIAPGSLFSSNMLAQPAGLRINVARAADARFFRFLSALRDGQGADQPTSANTNGPDSRF